MAVTGSANFVTLRAARPFRGADEETLRELADAATSHVFGEGEPLWRAGEPASVFTCIQRGLVQIERTVASGERAVMGIFGPRECVGTAAALEQGVYPADALAVTDVRVLRVPGALVNALMARDPQLGRALQGALIEHTRALFAKIDIVSVGSVPSRLALLLLHLHERFGDRDEQGVASVPIPIARGALARLVSARVETVIRALSALQKSGIIRATADGFEVPDLAALEAVAKAG